MELHHRGPRSFPFAERMQTSCPQTRGRWHTTADLVPQGRLPLTSLNRRRSEQKGKNCGDLGWAIGLRDRANLKRMALLHKTLITGS
jgi:hypothetical protein